MTPLAGGSFASKEDGGEAKILQYGGLFGPGTTFIEDKTTFMEDKTTL